MKFEGKYIELKTVIVTEVTKKTLKAKYWMFPLPVDVAFKL